MPPPQPLATLGSLSGCLVVNELPLLSSSCSEWACLGAPASRPAPLGVSRLRPSHRSLLLYALCWCPHTPNIAPKPPSANSLCASEFDGSSTKPLALARNQPTHGPFVLPLFPSERRYWGRQYIYQLFVYRTTLLCPKTNKAATFIKTWTICPWLTYQFTRRPGGFS